MDGYTGMHGEGFLGIGYSYPVSAADGTGTETTSALQGNSADHDGYGPAKNLQPVFVPAQIAEKNAEVARSKAKDILSSILQGMNSSNASEARPNSAQSNDTNGTTGNDTRNNGGEIQQNKNPYPPQETFTSSFHGPSSIESDAQAARERALGILRKFQYPSNENESAIETEAQAARIKAMGILRKFQSEPNGNHNSDSGDDAHNGYCAAQHVVPSNTASNYAPQEIHSAASDVQSAHFIPEQEHQYLPRHEVPSQPQPSTSFPMVPTTVPIVTTPPWELAKRRRVCLDKDEERKHRALLKNLQYVARLEEERLAKQLVEVRQVKTLEQQIDERYQQKIEYRMQKRNNGSNNINTSGAGIGTKQRRKAEAKRQKTALPPSLRQKHQGNRGYNGSGKNGSDSVAIYVSNLPTDGSVDEATVHGLFSAYGSLRKIHFYVDKITGRKKGDALVIYSLVGEEDQTVLTESVCSQVNGCELPGGSVLRVEPSDPYHKVTAKTSNKKSRTNHQPLAESSVSRIGENTQGEGNAETVGEASAAAAEKQTGETVGGANEEEDLDDFFASLE